MAEPDFKYDSEKAYDDAIKNAEEKRKTAEDDIEKTHTELDSNAEINRQEKELKELANRIQAIKQPYLNRIKNLETQRENAKSEKIQLGFEKNLFMESLKFREAQENGEFEAETVIAFLRMHRLFPSPIYYTPRVELKKVLKNGIKAFRLTANEYGTEYTKLFLFKGTGLVGYWCKRKSKHPGDPVYSRAWIGVSLLRDGYHGEKAEPDEQNDLEELMDKEHKITYQNREKHPFYRDSGKTDPTMAQFLEFAENFKGELKYFDFNDGITIKILKDAPTY